MRLPLLLAILAIVVLALQLMPPPPPSVAVERAPRRAGGSAPTIRLRDPAPAQDLARRSPFGGIAGDVPSADVNADAASLLGVARAGGFASALVRAGGGDHTLRPGDDFGAWTVGRIGAESIELTRGSERRILTLGGPPAVLNRTSP